MNISGSSSRRSQSRRPDEDTGERLVNAALERRLKLRLLGAMAFQLHCPKYGYVTAKLQRTLSDVDLVGYGSDRQPIDSMMREFGYLDEPMVTTLFGARRMIWDNRAK